MITDRKVCVVCEEPLTPKRRGLRDHNRSQVCSNKCYKEFVGPLLPKGSVMRLVAEIHIPYAAKFWQIRQWVEANCFTWGPDMDEKLNPLAYDMVDRIGPVVIKDTGLVYKRTETRSADGKKGQVVITVTKRET